MDPTDITVGNEGAIITFTPETEHGESFLRNDLQSEPWQWLGRTLCVDHRMAGGVIGLAHDAGLLLSGV